MVVVSRLPARKYCQPLTSVSARARPSSRSASISAVSCSPPGQRAVPTATDCTSVFAFAMTVAGTARPRRPQWMRRRLTASSRAPMRATGTHQNTSMATSITMAPKTRTLSASGSRNAPDRVVPWRRAIHPSMPSVPASTIQRTKVVHDAPSSAMRANRTGETSRRVTVTKLAGVRRADGP